MKKAKSKETRTQPKVDKKNTANYTMKIVTMIDKFIREHGMCVAVEDGITLGAYDNLAQATFTIRKLP